MAEQCLALVEGHSVRWTGGVEGFSRLPGRHKLLGGWLITRR
jgi:hypothetical protein